MRIFLCDDDLLVTEQLQKYLGEYFRKNNLKLPEITVYNNGEALLQDTGKADIVMLDVEMPGLSGICVGSELKKRNPDIIIFIVTSYPEYLDEAMRFHVFRYLSKPIDKQRLFRNLKDALGLYSTVNKAIPVETKAGIYAVPFSDIICIEALERKVIIYTTSSMFESIHSIQYWCDTLPTNCFIQSHRSYIVNLKYVSDFDHTLIHLCNGGQISNAYLTRRKYTEFKEAYLLYLESMR